MMYMSIIAYIYIELFNFVDFVVVAGPRPQGDQSGNIECGIEHTYKVLMFLEQKGG